MNRLIAALALCAFAPACVNDRSWDRAYAVRDLESPDTPRSPDTPESPSADQARELVAQARTLASEASVTLDVELLDRARAVLVSAELCPAEEGWIHYHAAHVAYLGMLRALYAPGVSDRDAEFERHVGAAIAHAGTALASGADESEAAALLSAIHGLRIAHDFWLGMTLGPRADDLIERALRTNPQNPRAWLVKGTALFHTPALFGGDTAEALEAFQRAAALFESTAPVDEIHPDWGRAEVHAWCGQALSALGRDAEAMSAYQRALELAPDYRWVRNELMPKLERKLAAKRGA